MVDQEHVDHLGCSLADCRGAIGDDDRLVARTPERLAQKRAHRLHVVQDEHPAGSLLAQRLAGRVAELDGPGRFARLATSSRQGRGPVGSSHGHGRRGGARNGRQVDDEVRAPAARAGLVAEPAFMATHDVERHRQAQTRSLAGLLGGEERDEQARPVLLGHTRTIVGHADPDHLAAIRPVGHRRSQLESAGRPVVEHGLDGVGGQVEQDLLQLRAVDRHTRQVRFDRDRPVDAAAL